MLSELLGLVGISCANRAPGSVPVFELCCLVREQADCVSSSQAAMQSSAHWYILKSVWIKLPQSFQSEWVSHRITEGLRLRDLEVILSIRSAQPALPRASCLGPWLDTGPMSDCQPSEDVSEVLRCLKWVYKPMFKRLNHSQGRLKTCSADEV